MYMYVSMKQIGRHCIRSRRAAGMNDTVVCIIMKSQSVSPDHDIHVVFAGGSDTLKHTHNHSECACDEYETEENQRMKEGMNA